MGYTIKTPIKLFMMFLVFQILLNSFIEIAPNMQTLNDDDDDFVTWLTAEVNIIAGEEEGASLLDDFLGSIKLQNLFTDGIISSFFGILKLFAELILFIIEIVILLLITPSIIMNILVYGFIAISSMVYALTLIINVGFYMTMFYIILKSRTESK